MKTDFAQRLLDWYDNHGRKDLPWQHPRSAYRVWISEIMLQQTQVTTVIPYFERFITRFANLADLANADQDEVLHYWSGLGYYARARNLHRTAQQVLVDHQGELPKDIDQLMALPGIGRSTAAAILAQAHGQRHAILDGNVKRVLARHDTIEGWTGSAAVLKQLWAVSEQYTPRRRLADYTQAIMDLGATVCIRTKPVCTDCPVQTDCQAYNQQRTAELPTKKQKKTLPVKSVQMLLVRNQRRQVLLEKRPPAGIWGGLWSLPENTVDQNPTLVCQQRWGFTTEKLSELPVFRHTFSHYHLDIQPILVDVKDPINCVMESGRALWYNTEQPKQLGLPKPVNWLLKHYILNSGSNS